jgi:NADPH2:quinone reductase
MRAMVLPRFGGSNLFEMHELERPEPGCGEVLVRVVASAVNPVDAKLRVDGGWAKLDPPVILGYDVAGIVEEVGPGITDFKNRRRGLLHSGNLWQPTWELRRLRCRSAAIVARKPTGLSFVEASAIPLAGGTAWEAVVRRLAVRPGETILIHGGAGGVGS